jgi:hypothetical protein
MVILPTDLIHFDRNGNLLGRVMKMGLTGDTAQVDLGSKIIVKSVEQIGIRKNGFFRNLLWIIAGCRRRND